MTELQAEKAVKAWERLNKKRAKLERSEEYQRVKKEAARIKREADRLRNELSTYTQAEPCEKRKDGDNKFFKRIVGDLCLNLTLVYRRPQEASFSTKLEVTKIG